MTAETVVRAQVGAFNAHDLDAFLDTYADDAVVVGVAPEPLRGRDALRAFYGPRLQDGSLSCVVDAAVSFGARWVVAREWVSTSAGATETIATFDVVDGRIARASIVKA